MGATDRRPHATRTHRAQSGPTKLNTNTSLTWIPMEPSFESAVGVRGGRPHSLRSMLLRGAGGGSAHSTFYTAVLRTMVRGVTMNSRRERARADEREGDVRHDSRSAVAH